jgi:hypothetical protein
MNCGLGNDRDLGVCGGVASLVVVIVEVCRNTILETR